MTTVVTGGAGFIGSHLCDSLVEDGETVVCLDNLGSGRRENVAHLDATDEFHLANADVRDGIESALEPLDANPSNVDRIYHLASRASPDDFERFPLDIALTNSVGTYRVLEFAEKFDARVVYASTSEVYGEPEEHPQTESYHGNVNIRGPRACYDESKRMGETFAEIFAQEFDVDVRTVRPFNTYGPRMRADDGRVIPTFVTQALGGRDLTVYGDGSQTRSFMYIDDLVDGLRRVMRRSGLANEVVNLGSTTEITINELAERVADVVGGGVGVAYEPLPEDDPSRRQPDISHAKAVLDWEPVVGLREGLERTVDFFRTGRESSQND